MRLHNPFTTRRSAILTSAVIAAAVIGGGMIYAHSSYYVPSGSYAQAEDVRPGQGGLAGNTMVTITGKDFGPGTEVRFGTVTARTVKIVSSTSIVATTGAAGEPGIADVTITRHGKIHTLVGSFRYSAEMKIISVTPATGPATGGQEVIVRGTGFARDSYIDLGGAHVTKLTFVNANTVRVVTTPHAPGVVDVNATNNDDSAFLEAGYTYQ